MPTTKCPGCSKKFSYRKGDPPWEALKHRAKHIRKAHPTLAARRSRERSIEPKAPHHRGSRRESTKSFAEHHFHEIEAAEKAYPGVFHPHGCRCEGCRR